MDVLIKFIVTHKQRALFIG